MGRPLRPVSILGSYQRSWTSRNLSGFRTQLSEQEKLLCRER